MYCEHPVTYVIKSGDNLFLLSRRFKTTVQMILFLNPGINPYNLQIGSTLIICPGQDYVPDDGSPNGGEYPAPEIPDQPYPDKPHPDKPCFDSPNRPCPPLPDIPKPIPPDNGNNGGGNNGNGNNGNGGKVKDCDKILRLFSDMRLAWSQHAYWTRAVIVSTAERLADQPDTVGRLMQNPYAVAKIFNEFFSIEQASAIERLIAEHLDIGGRLVIALRDGQMDEANALNRRWYLNAEQLAAAISALSPHFDEEKLCALMFSHLEMLTRMTAYRLGGSFIDDIAEFDNVEREILEIADYLSGGIIMQFPQKF